MALDPVTKNPEHYRVVFENERVRVLDKIGVRSRRDLAGALRGRTAAPVADQPR